MPHAATPLALAAVLLLGLSAKPLLYAQATPAWTDLSGATSADETLVSVLPAADGGALVVGYGDAPDGSGRVEASLARLDGGGAATWTRAVAVARDGDLRPLAVLPHGTDSVAVVYVEAGRGGDFGGLFLQCVDAATGETGAFVPADFGTDRAFGNALAVALPDSDDVLVGGEYADGDGDGEAFVARLRPDGSVAWFSDELADFSAGVFFNAVTDLTLAQDVAYVLGDDEVVARLSLSEGTVLGYVSSPFPGAFPLGARLASHADTLWWAIAGIDELRLAFVPDAAADAEAFASTPVEFTEVIVDVHGLRFGGGQIVVYGGFGRVVTAVAFGRDGAVDARQTILAADFLRADDAGPSAAALAPEAGLLLAGAISEPGGGEDAALVRYDFGGGFASVDYVAGRAADGANSLVVDVLPAATGGVHALRVSDNRLNVRTLARDGALVADVPVATDRLLVTYYGAATLPGGDLFLLAFVQTAGVNELYLQRIRPDGTVAAERNLGSLRGLQRPATNHVRLTPAGHARVFYTFGPVDDLSTEVRVFDADLEELSAGNVLADEGYSTVTNVLPIPGSDDLLLYGSTGFPGIDPDYVARVDADIVPVWYAPSPGVRGNSAALVAVALAPDGTEAFALDERASLARLDLADGRELSRRAVEAPADGFDAGDVRAANGSIVLLTAEETFDASTGWFGTEASAIRLDPVSGTLETLVRLPVVGAVTPSFYREIDGQTYIGGARGFGLGVRGLVVAYSQILSPVAESAAPVASLPVWPNPARAGGVLRFGESLADWRLYDVTGRELHRGGQATESTALPMTPGTYFLRGEAGDGRVFGATVSVLR